jgi:subfamily B ATP-binding cassette protein MsbA
LQRGVAAADSLFSVIDEKDEIDTGVVDAGRLRGDIEFDEVSFSYPGEGGTILDKLSIRVNAGETLAIVGQSGSGKTTLATLLPRFYEIDSGAIRLDGRSIQDFTLASLRNNISLVSQDVVLFNDSILNNLAYGELRKHSREEIMEAAEAAHVCEFAESMPDGIDSMVGDRGMLLSGGQRQRIAIGRALLKDAPILILDEATSSLDAQSERKIQDALDVLMQGRTTLVIAHRLSTVENADRIIVLENGQIAESGTHDELLGRDGLYASLHRMQFSNSD